MWQYIYNLDYIEGSKTKSQKLLYQGLVIDLKPFYKRVVFLYIRETPNSEESDRLFQSLKSSDCIIGDMNLNPKIPDQKNKLLAICGETKSLALEEMTTIYDSQLEHIIVENEIKSVVFATAYHNFSSDHKSVVFRFGSLASSYLLNIGIYSGPPDKKQTLN